MGQKTNPIGLRVAVNKDWRSKWYADKKEFSKLLTEDRIIRTLLKKKLETASVPRILIERATNRCRVTILTARPGVVIGRKGSEIDKLKEELSKMTGKEVGAVFMEQAQTGSPMTYMLNGRQYIIVASGVTSLGLMTTVLPAISAGSASPTPSVSG